MTPKPFLLLILCLLLLVTIRPGDAQTGTLLSACQSVAEPGDYALTTDLDGAPVAVSVGPQLSSPYTGDRTLGHTCIEIVASDVTLDCQGHTLTGSGEESADTTGIFVSGTMEAPLFKVTVENCVTTGYQFGLYAANLQDSSMRSNEARRNMGTGFYLTGLVNVAITANTSEGNDPDGILLIGDTNITVSDNVAFYNRMRGITFEGCQDCIASHNTSYSHGVLGFGIYGSQGMTLEENTAYNNRYHGFAILHEAGSATFTGNEAYGNEGSGFFLQGSRDNRLINNLSHDNHLDGITIFHDSQPNTFENNTLRDNSGYGVFSDAPIDSATFADDSFSGNGSGPTGSAEPDTIDWCGYTGFGLEEPCDPVFTGGPNLKDPQSGGGVETPATASTGGESIITNVRIVGEPIYYPAFGDLWMATWADDDRLFLTWGDGTGFGDGYPVGYPAYESSEPITPTFCEAQEVYMFGEQGHFPCWLWCNIFGCGADKNYPPAPLTDIGVLAFEGPVPEFTDVSIASIDVPSGQPFFLVGPEAGTLDVDATERNDKPGSLLFIDGRLYFAGYSPAANPTLSYVAYSDDYGQTWTEVPNSPWDETSNFRMLMFINMGQNYSLNEDGYVYAFGFNATEGVQRAELYLTRVPVEYVADYSAYEYFSGLEGDAPAWSSNQADAAPLDTLSTVGQASVMYHEDTQRYLFMTGVTEYSPATAGPFGYGGLFEAPQPWGPWTQVAVLCFQPECDDGRYNPVWTERDFVAGTEPGKYVPGLIPKGAGPNHVYFTIAGGSMHYQLQIGKLEWDLAN